MFVFQVAVLPIDCCDDSKVLVQYEFIDANASNDIDGIERVIHLISTSVYSAGLRCSFM